MTEVTNRVCRATGNLREIEDNLLRTRGQVVERLQLRDAHARERQVELQLLEKRFLDLVRRLNARGGIGPRPGDPGQAQRPQSNAEADAAARAAAKAEDRRQLEELRKGLEEAIEKSLALAPFKGIVAITRGGLVPAAIIARELDVRLIDTVCITSYSEDEIAGSTAGVHKAGELKLLKGDAGKMWGDGTGWLIIDDLVDTGITAKAVRQLLPKAHFATIYAKPSGRPMVDSYITEVSQDTWILFPWDMEAVMSKPIVELRSGR